MNVFTNTRLSNKWRPRKLTQILGQTRMIKTLLGYLARGMMPPTIVLLGDPGTGKTTTARNVAAALNCPNRTPDGQGCGDCERCRPTLQNPRGSWDLAVIDAASHGLVAEAKKDREHFYAYERSTPWVILFDEVHRMSPQAKEVFLSVWEEPPANRLSILATTDEPAIPHPVTSRSLTFYLEPLKAEVMVPHLRQICEEDGIEADDALLRAIWAKTGGLAREANNELESCWVTGITRGTEIDGETVDLSLDLLGAILSGDERAARAIGERAATLGTMAKVAGDLFQSLQALQRPDSLDSRSDSEAFETLKRQISDWPAGRAIALTDAVEASGKVTDEAGLVRLFRSTTQTLNSF